MASGDDDDEACAPSDDVASARTLASAARPVSPSAHPTHAYQRTREPRDSFEGEVLAGRYELGSRLGAGGMGEVYRARHLALDMPIAVKIMHPQISAVPEFATRFLHEARATSRIAHKNVVRIIDFGADGDLHFIVMELLQGEPLSKRIRRRGYLLLSEVGDIVGQIFTGLEAVHAVGVVHRDLKPDNVFLARESDGTEVVKLVDFGLAHVDPPPSAEAGGERGAKLTKPDMVAGTPEYMSPEQCRSLDVGPSADLYSAGCILHELLALVPPFRGKTHMEVMTQQLFLPPPSIERPEEVEPLPPALDRLRRSLLAKSPERRPATAAAAREALAQCLAQVGALDDEQRKAAAARGTREERAPSWPSPGAASPAASFGPATSGGASEQGDSSVRVTWITLAGASALDETLRAGLAAQGIEVALAGSLEAALTTAPSALTGAPAVCVLELAAEHEADFEAALREVARARALAPKMPLLVGTRLASAQHLTKLVEQGASDVARAPLDAATLAKKLSRLARRRR